MKKSLIIIIIWLVGLILIRVGGYQLGLNSSNSTSPPSQDEVNDTEQTSPEDDPVTTILNEN